MKGIIEANSGLELSASIGSIFGEAEVINRRPLPPESIKVIADREIVSWQKLGEPLADGWVRDVTRSGADGKFMLRAARQLIAEYEARSTPER